MAKKVSNGIQLLCYSILIFVKTSHQFYQRKKRSNFHHGT